MKPKAKYWMLVIDDDQKEFNIIGPVVDDTLFDVDIISMQNEGRSIRCQAIPADHSVSEIAQSYSHQYGYKFTKAPIIQTRMTAQPSIHGIPYSGPLPKYAKGADPYRLVRVLCKGTCGSVRWAVMNKGFPGIDVLRGSQLGDYEATCLVCGRIAKDSYNWLR